MKTALPTAATGRRSRKAALAAAPAAPVLHRAARRTIRKFELWSVLKVSLCFYLSGMVVTIVAGIVLWMLAAAFGVVKNVEDFMNQLLSAKHFTFLSLGVLEGAVLVGVVLVALLVLLTVLAAAFYNLFAELVGGVEVIVDEEQPGPVV